LLQKNDRSFEQKQEKRRRREEIRDPDSEKKKRGGIDFSSKSRDRRARRAREEEGGMPKVGTNDSCEGGKSRAAERTRLFASLAWNCLSAWKRGVKKFAYVQDRKKEKPWTPRRATITLFHRAAGENA